MTNSFNGGSIIESLLGWFRELFNALFGMITGSSGSGLLKWLMGSWKGLLIVLLIAGCSLNLIIHIIRWRPHWWWFAKKRMLVDDSIFEPKKRKKSRSAPSPVPKRRPSTIVPRRTGSTGTKKNLFETSPRPAKKRSRT